MISNKKKTTATVKQTRRKIHRSKKQMFRAKNRKKKKKKRILQFYRDCIFYIQLQIPNGPRLIDDIFFFSRKRGFQFAADRPEKFGFPCKLDRQFDQRFNQISYIYMHVHSNNEREWIRCITPSNERSFYTPLVIQIGG